MKYFLHDSTSINQDLIVKLISEFNYEGFGIYNAIMERIAFMESPVNKKSAIFTLRLSKKQQRILDFCVKIGLFLEENGELFEENILENAKKYIIRKEKTREKVKKFRENFKKNNTLNQTHNKNVTVTERLCNQDVTTVKKSKVKENKEYNIEVLNLIEFCKPLFSEKYLNGESHKCFDELIRIDKYSIEQIKQAIENGKKDEFWRNQFLTPAKLRSKNKDGIFYIDFFINLKSKQIIQTNTQNSLFERYPNLKLLSEKYPDGKYHPDSNRFVTGNMIFDCFSGKRVVV